MVEGARLESVYRGNSIEGSNPSLSAMSLLWKSSKRMSNRSLMARLSYVITGASSLGASEFTVGYKRRDCISGEWLGGRDSNPDTQIQSLQSYR